MFMDFFCPSDFFEYADIFWFDAEQFRPGLDSAGWVMFECAAARRKCRYSATVMKQRIVRRSVFDGE